MAGRRKTRVVIADDHHVVLAGIQNVLASLPDHGVVGTASDGNEAVSLTEALRPDILLLDISMPGMNGLEVARRVREISPRIRIVVFSMSADRQSVLSLFRTGIAAYVLKEEPVDTLVDTLDTVMQGGTYYSQKIAHLLQNHMLELELGDGKDALDMQDGIARLSMREKEVFPLLADGLSVKDIADRLCISPKTVESHKYNILDKLHARSIADLTKIAIHKGLIQV